MQLFAEPVLDEKGILAVFMKYLHDVEQIAESYREKAESAEARERTRRFRARPGQPERRVLQPTPKWIPKYRSRRYNASGTEQELQDDTRDDATARGSAVPITPLTPEDSKEEVKKKEVRRKRFGAMVEQP